MWIWQQPRWPEFQLDYRELATALANAAAAVTEAQTRIGALLSDQSDELILATLTQDVVQTSAIEGERLNEVGVRSSLALGLGLDVGGLGPVDRNAEGIVEMLLDATRHPESALSVSRLCHWQAGLFPGGRSGLRPVAAGRWRDDAMGPMQVVSGRHGRERVHFEAPPAHRLSVEMQTFIDWFETAEDQSPWLRSGIAHLWFITLHPFDDGNGRVARAVADLLHSRALWPAPRVFSLSAQLQTERAEYYRQLERAQRGGLDITEWLGWYLGMVTRAARVSLGRSERVIAKARFWQRVAPMGLNTRQVHALNRVLDEFDKPVNTRTWAALTKVSKPTAYRDLQALVAAGVLKAIPAGGRSAGYVLRIE